MISPHRFLQPLDFFAFNQPGFLIRSSGSLSANKYYSPEGLNKFYFSATLIYLQPQKVFTSICEKLDNVIQPCRPVTSPCHPLPHRWTLGGREREAWEAESRMDTNQLNIYLPRTFETFLLHCDKSAGLVSLCSQTQFYREGHRVSTHRSALRRSRNDSNRAEKLALAAYAQTTRERPPAHS